MTKRDEDKLNASDPEPVPTAEAVSIVDPLPGGLHDLELPSSVPPPHAEDAEAEKKARSRREPAPRPTT